MDDFEDKLSSILNNPEMMGKIMNMAQSFGGQEAPPSEELLPDPGMLKSLAGMARQSGIDNQQQTLLKALHPYLSGQRIQKLENAMRAAKMAKLVVSVLGVQGGKFLTGR